MMTDAEKKQLLRDAKSIVARGIQAGLISHAEPKQQFRKFMRPNRRAEYIASLSPEELEVAEALEASRPDSRDYPNTQMGYTQYRADYRNWCERRRKAVRKAGGGK